MCNAEDDIGAHEGDRGAVCGWQSKGARHRRLVRSGIANDHLEDLGNGRGDEGARDKEDALGAGCPEDAHGGDDCGPALGVAQHTE